MSIVNVAFWSATHLPHAAYYKSQSFSWLPPILGTRAFHFDRKWDCPSHLRTSVPPLHVPFCRDVLHESLSAFPSPLESRLIHPALLQHPKSSWNLRSWSAHRRTPLRRNGGRSGASRTNMYKDIASP